MSIGGISYEAFGCKISFVPHAIERVRQRFGFTSDIMIPNRMIVKASQKVVDGDEFHIKTPLCTFVCKRDSENEIAIVTVLFSR